MLVDEATGEVNWTVEAHPPRSHLHFMIRARVAMSPDDRLIASVSRHDRHWKLWDDVRGAVHRVGATHDGTGGCICRNWFTNLVDWVVPRNHPLQAGCPVVAHIGGLVAVAFSPCAGLPRWATTARWSCGTLKQVRRNTTCRMVTGAPWRCPSRRLGRG